MRVLKVAYYSHEFSVYDVTVTCNFAGAKHTCFGELSSQGMKKNSIRHLGRKIGYHIRVFAAIYALLKKKTHFLKATHPIQIHRAVLEKLPFGKKFKKF